VVAAGAVGVSDPNGRETYGDSLIVDYWGRIVHACRAVEVYHWQVDLQRQRNSPELSSVGEHRVYAGE